MRRRAFPSLITAAAVVAVATCAPAFLTAQAPAAVGRKTAAQPAAKKPWTMPRTPDGQPDLQGYWTSLSFTPMERPAMVDGPFFECACHEGNNGIVNMLEGSRKREKDAADALKKDRRDGR